MRQAPSALSTASTYDATVGALEHSHAVTLCVESRATSQLNDLVHRASQTVPLENVFGPPDHEKTFGALGETLPKSADAHEEEAAARPPPSLASSAHEGGLASPARGGAGSTAPGTPGRAEKSGVLGSTASGSLSGTAAAAASGAISPVSHSRLRLTVKEPTRTGVLGPFAVDAPEQAAAFGALSDVLAKDERHGIQGLMARTFFQGGHEGIASASAYYVTQRPLGGLFATAKPEHYTAGGQRYSK